MSAQGQDDTDKTHEATPQKLLEARKKGEVPKSNDLLAAAAYAGLLVALLTAGASGLQDVGTVMMILLDQPDSLDILFFGGGAIACTRLLSGCCATGCIVSWTGGSVAAHSSSISLSTECSR